MMWSTNVENISSRRNSFGLSPHFCQQNKHIPLKKMIIRTTCKAVEYCACEIFNSDILFTSTFITLVKSVQTSHQPTRAQSKKTILKAWNYITIDFHQEMGQEFSTIVQIIVKADRGKAIAWRSVSCKMTCYYILDVKTLQSLSLHFVPTLQSAVYILYPVCSLLSAFCTNRYPWYQYSLFLVTVIHTTHTIYHKIPVYELIWHFRSLPR